MQIQHFQSLTSSPPTPRLTPDGTCDSDLRERAGQIAQHVNPLIEQILSGNSRAFLKASRQTGGE